MRYYCWLSPLIINNVLINNASSSDAQYQILFNKYSPLRNAALFRFCGISNTLCGCFRLQNNRMVVIVLRIIEQYTFGFRSVLLLVRRDLCLAIAFRVSSSSIRYFPFVLCGLWKSPTLFYTFVRPVVTIRKTCFCVSSRLNVLK